MLNSNLYFLNFPQVNAIKIGKADDIENRYQSLRRCWGNADLNNSYCVSLPSGEVYKYEKSLHILFSKFNKKVGKGDGATEFFEIDILKDIIHFFNNSTDYNIKKGVVFKEKLTVFEKKRNFKKDKLKHTNNEMFLTFENTVKKLFKLTKLLIFIKKYEERMIFQYDLVNGEYFLRMKLNENLTEKQFENLIKKIWDLLSYGYRSHTSIGGFNLSTWNTSSFDEKTFQMVITNPLDLEKGRHIPIAFREIWIEMVQPILSKLPKKSKGSIEDIPIYFPSWYKKNPL